MSIDTNLIQDAKRSLGTEGARIIASDLNIQKWDDKHLKGCCPFHNENTPSFVWNKKDNYFKCFGCGETLDIVDHYIDKGMTFREASKELFKQAGMYFEDEVIERPKKDNKPYKQPKEERPVGKSKAREYLNLRGISDKTIDYAGIKEDSKGNIAFEFYDDKDRLLLIKYRPPRKLEKGENKTWSQKGADTAPILYGMHQIDPNKPLLITEGEIDRLAAIESGFKNAVSVPFGAENYHWIEYNWDWLEQFNEIIVWSDNDLAGESMRKEVIPRLGEYRTKYVKSQYEDINIQLFRAGKESVLNSIRDAKEVPIRDVVRMADVEDYNIHDLEKIKSGLSGLDRFISGFFLGTVNVITGVNGSGKSTFINQVCVCEPVDQGYKVFVMSGELTNQQLRNWIEYPMAGKSNISKIEGTATAPSKYYIKKDIKNKMRNWYKDSIYFYDNDLDFTATSILRKMEELARRHGVKVFLLDNLMTIDLESNQYELNLKQKDFMKELITFARRFNSIVHLVAHPRKTENVQRLSKMDVAGSGDITNLAHYVTAIHRVTDKEKEDKYDKKGVLVEEGCPFDCIIDLFKNRPLGHQDKSIGVKYDMASKRFYGSGDNIDKLYGWVKEPEQEVIEGFYPVPNDPNIPF